MHITDHKGREIRHPWRWPALFLIVIAVTLAMIFLIAALPITIPLSWLLKKSGRYGFFRWEGRKAVYNVDVKAFQRR